MRAHFFCIKNLLKPLFLLCFWQQCSKNKLGPVNSYKNPILGPVNNSTEYIYIYVCHIYIYVVELKAGPRFGVSSVKNWSKPSVKNWSKFFCFTVFSHSIVFWGIFENTNSVTLCQNSVCVFFFILGMSKMRCSKRKLHFVFLSFLCWRNRNKKKMEKAKKPCKNKVFQGGHAKM